MRHAIVKRRGGFTVVDLLFVVASLVVAFATVGFVIGTTARRNIRRAHDSTQVRGIHQGLVLFAQSNADTYVLPSLIDTANSTLDGPAAFKDTTSHIISILIFHDFLTPETCVSPAETNPAIRIDTKYEYNNPRKLTTSQGQPLWDPDFNADFTAVNPARVAGFSYAHVLPTGLRGKQKWNNSFNSNDAIIANRGPKVTSATFGKAPVVVPSFDKKSNTLRIHGGRSTWEGNVTYNDNSVVFETSMASHGKLRTYRDAGPTRQIGNWDDLLFFDEPEDTDHTNNYLVNVNKIGENGPELIWD